MVGKSGRSGSPQKELAYNRLLPYASQLDEEADRLLQEILRRIAHAVILKELKPACAVWTSRLLKYVKLYGLKFTKECHIELIKLVYDLVIIPDLEPSHLHKFSTLLILLTKKNYLISPEELTLEWRPIYNIGKKVFSKGVAAIGMYHYPSRRRNLDDENDDDDDDEDDNPLSRLLKILKDEMPILQHVSADHDESLECTFGSMVQCIKPYFPTNATREILDEFLPKFTPWNNISPDTIQDLALYLPFQMLPSYRDQGIKLWVDDFISIWQVCHNGIHWEQDMMTLMANVAQHNIGHIDWEPHMSFMFTKFLRSFNLPVVYKQAQNNKHVVLDTTSMAYWIISVLGPNSSAQKYLDNFMTTVATYLHGANTGRWSIKLRDLLKKLPIQFVNRLHKERSNHKVTWDTKAPENYRLTPDDITRFVECLLDVAVQAMFSRLGTGDACVALQHLALLRPDLVIPPIIEKMWNTLDSLTEPHKLTCAMQSVVAVARPLVTGFTNGYPEGPTHVIPLLLSSLPGLDPNDFKKTLVTLHFITVFCNLIPIVNCSGASEYWPDLTEEERTVCEATAQFEDFVLEYFDKVFVLIESSSLEHTRMEQKEEENTRSKLEFTSEGALASTTVILLVQSSTSIFKMALKKVFNFVSQQILETNVAGQTAASICRALARVNPHETFKLFIPHLCEAIERFCENDEVFREERLDKELSYNLLLLSQIVDKNGADLLPYVPRILQVVDKTINLVCKEGYNYVSTTLKNIVSCLSVVYPDKCRSSLKDYDASVKDFLAIREWGVPGDIKECNLKWHVPNQDEIDCVEMIVRKYLKPELDRLNDYVEGKITLTRDGLNKSLSIIKALLSANHLMPSWDDTPIQLVESHIPWERFDLHMGVKGAITMADGGNCRKAISDTMHALQAKLLNSNEDDTKSLCKLITIWESLTATNSNSVTLFENHLKVFNAVKKALENKLLGRSGHLRVMLVDRAVLQHEFRMQSVSGPLTIPQAENMKAIFQLATSGYSEVRFNAQCRLNWMVSNFAYSFKIIMPQLIECFQVDPNVEHERLKGALYCILGPKQTPIVAKHDWSVVSALWPALIHSNPSEKPSVIKLLDSLVRSILTNFPTITINLKWSDSCIERAKDLLSESDLNSPEFTKCMERRDEVFERFGKENEESYLKLLNVLVEGANSTNLHWRHSLMCISLLPAMVHLDVPFPASAINLILKSLINDSIVIRKISIKLMVFVFKQRKMVHKKDFVESSKYLPQTPPESTEKVLPGFRPDNAWFQCDSVLSDEEEWDSKEYIHHEWYGYNYWPKSIKMYLPIKEQPEYSFSLENMSEDRQEIYNFFSSQENFDKLINYLSLEDKKGKDKFGVFKSFMYKGLFANFLDTFLPMFAERLQKLMVDKQESAQRCGAEIIAGIVRGSKHWPYKQAERLRELLTPVIKSALENMIPEILQDWGMCFITMFENMNISRIFWILKLLEESLLEDVNSAQMCCRLYLVQVSIWQHPWRLAAYSHHILNILRNKKLLEHPYQNVRDRVACLLSCVFEKDISFTEVNQSVAPSITDFLEEIAPRMEFLVQEGMKGISANNESKPMCIGNHVNESIAHGSNHKTNNLNHNKAKFMKELTRKNSSGFSNNKNLQGVEKSIMKMFNEVSANPNSLINLKDMPEGMDSLIMEKLNQQVKTSLRISEDGDDVTKDSEYDINVRLYKTVFRWITMSIYRYPCGIKPSYYTLLPVACVLGNREGDEELHHLSALFLATLAESAHSLDNLKIAFKTMQRVFQFPSWCARVSCLSFLQSLVFHNMALVINSEIKAEVHQITLELMNDSSVEVREAAAVMLSGLLHCEVLTDIPELMKHFKTMCNGGKVVKGPNRQEILARRHCGILGLCAFIAAHPYTVPPYLPEIFSILGRHINDPMPIPATITKTLGDFKRTHHDDWQTHQLKFTEEDLTLLSDLTVPPSYYA